MTEDSWFGDTPLQKYVDELECWRCHEFFKPDVVYEFPGEYIYWHKCADNFYVQVTAQKKRVWKKYVPEWVKPSTAKDHFNKTLKLIYGDNREVFEDET